ncbi:unnamed protein product [Cylicocyclus nassatus]|uniref:Uncharacterized protein n=1 Tax=Cylicocyclus nassatus TaxID=53992 RepID=A0AA36GMV1_CYLNA|nr:unnamed protein product [Cylicocyclus nassatus]
MKIILLLVALFCMTTSVDTCSSDGRAACMQFCSRSVNGRYSKRMIKGFCEVRQKCETSGRKRICRKLPVCICRFPSIK